MRKPYTPHNRKISGKPHPVILALRQERISQGILQHALASSAGYSHSFISSIESGRYSPNLLALDDYIQALGFELTIRRKESKMNNWLYNFILESNRIEGIDRVSLKALDAHETLLSAKVLTIERISDFVTAIQPDAELRSRPGLNVRVGDHFPLPGGPQIEDRLQNLLYQAGQRNADPWLVHTAYENLHPYTDGNGRSGRAIWLWMMKQRGGTDWTRAQALGFLHTFYYQTLEHSDGR